MDSPSSPETPIPIVDLYSLLKVDRNATEEEIHRAFKSLSTTFHPDKLPPSTTSKDRERIQQIFLEFKRANDILMDPVLRLTYDQYGEEGVTLVKRIQQEQWERQSRKRASAEADGDSDDKGQNDTNEEDHDHGDDDDDAADVDADDILEATLYKRVERLLAENCPLQAKEELKRFMEQHNYHEELSEQHQVQLTCNMEFPSVLDLTETFYQGREYLQHLKRINIQRSRGLSSDERKHIQQEFREEQRLLDYQINHLRDSQKSSVGFTLSSSQPRTVRNHLGEKVQPKWSMAMGGSADLVYPSVHQVAELAGKKVSLKDQKHPASTFLNVVFQPVPNTQINWTANLSNSQSHQFVLGTARTFTNRSSHRYSLTYLSKSPLDTNMILNFKTFRHIKDIGMASGGISMGANGKFLNWNANWEAVKGTRNKTVHKCSAKVSVGMMQGNSLRLSYKWKSRQRSWLDEYIRLPKTMKWSAVFSSFPKIEAMFTQDLTSLANSSTLGFGMEHDIAQSCWMWVWEWNFNNSTFRIPIPVLHLGAITNPTAYYAERMYYGLYSLLVQSLVADILCGKDERILENGHSSAECVKKTMADKLLKPKTKSEAQQQILLMESVADRKRYKELQSDGLVILKATYWLEHQRKLETEIHAMDATVQLQFWVANGKLYLPAAVPKSSLLGFYDLKTELKVESNGIKGNWSDWIKRPNKNSNPNLQPTEPQLTIRYTYKGYTYEITVSEKEELNLPSTRARQLGKADIVQ